MLNSCQVLSLGWHTEPSMTVFPEIGDSFVCDASHLAYIKLLGPLYTRWHRLHTRAISLHGFMTDMCFLHSLCGQGEVLTSVTHTATKDLFLELPVADPNSPACALATGVECNRKQPARREVGEA